MNDKFMVIDATDEIVVGGFGNLEGNLGLLKYSKEEIRKMIKENNNENDNIRLINSLLQSLKELKEEKQELIDYLKEEINERKLTGNDEDYIKLDVYEEVLSKLVESDQIEKE